MGRPIGKTGVSAARLAPCAPAAAAGLTPRPATRTADEGAGHDLVQPRVSAHRFPRFAIDDGVVAEPERESIGRIAPWLYRFDGPGGAEQREPPIDAARPTRGRGSCDDRRRVHAIRVPARRPRRRPGRCAAPGRRVWRSSGASRSPSRRSASCASPRRGRSAAGAGFGRPSSFGPPPPQAAAFGMDRLARGRVGRRLADGQRLVARAAARARGCR